MEEDRSGWGTVTELQGPSGPRRRLGAELRRLRVKRDLNLGDVAKRLRCSTSKISRLETGKGIPKAGDVDALIRLYGVTADTEQEMLRRLVSESREHGWWEAYTEGMSPERFMLDRPDRYPALETDAVMVRAFDFSALHGLLQTPAYTRSVLRAFLPRHDGWQIDRLADMRQERQRALARTPEQRGVHVVVDEAVLCRQVGGADVMAEALAHVLELSLWPNVSVQVLGFDRGVQRAHVGSFVLLEIPVEHGSDVVYVEGHAGDTYLEAPSDVQRYRGVFGDLTGTALDVERSRAVIDRYRDRHARSGAGS